MSVMDNVVHGIREQFPKFSKPAYSLSMRTTETGVQLCPAARKIESLITGKKRGYIDQHKFARRLQCRVSENDYRAIVERLTRSEDYVTINDLLRDLLRREGWIK